MGNRSCELPSVLCSSNISRGTKSDANISFRHQESMDFSISAQGPKEAIMLKPTNHNNNVDLVYNNGRDQFNMNLYKILIVNNSLHTYCSLGKDSRADGELLMYYKEAKHGSNYLIVCIPVMFSSPGSMFYNSKKNMMSQQANSSVKKMIQMAPLKTKQGEQTMVSGLDMNSLFPYGKPFYHEQQPSDNGDGCFGIKSNTIMIVYDKTDVHLLLDKQMEKEFNSKTQPANVSNNSKSSLWVKSNNSKGKGKGAKMTRNLKEGFENNENDDNEDTNEYGNNEYGNDNDNNDDNDEDNNDDEDNDIYIDCRPTGSDGKALYEEDLSLFKPSLNMGNFKKMDDAFSFMEKIKDSPAFYIFIGLLIALVIVKFGKVAVSKSREFLQKSAARKLAQ